MPPSATAGSGPLIITVHGANFTSGATVRFGDTVLNPRSVTPGVISVSVPASVLLSGRSVSLVADNSQAGPSGWSNAALFPIGVRVNSFSAIPRRFPVNEPRGVAAGSFTLNQDDHADLAVSSLCTSLDSICSPGRLELHPGTGTGNFNNVFVSGLYDRPGQMIAGALMVTATWNLAVVCDNGVEILLNDGSGEFVESFISVGRSGIATMLAGRFQQ